MKRKLLITGMLVTVLAGSTLFAGCSCTVSTDSNNATTNTSQNATANASQNSTQNATNNASQSAQAGSIQPGTYKLVQKTEKGVTMDEAQLNAAGKSRTLDVNADGTAVKKEADGDVDNYKYDNSKFTESDGDVKSYTISNDTITIVDGDETYVYKKA